MMNNLAIKFAVSTLAVAALTVSCGKTAEAQRPTSLSPRGVSPEQAAARAFAQAQAALQQGDLPQGLAFAEQAVEGAPRDAGYRMLLADIYLKSGRFQSAETSFADVMELRPGNVRAGLSLALSQIALGRNYQALTLLDSLQGSAAPGDLGLAYALAGRAERAIELLEPAARAPGASGRVRQNLALAYAFAGDWQRARTTAAQDVSPAELSSRMQQWASLTQPRASWDQVAAMLGVTPVQDPGQPVRLALAPPQPEPVAFAEAEPAAAPPPPPFVPMVQPIHAEAPASQPVREAEPEQLVRYAEAAQTLVAPQPAVIRASAPVPPPTATFERAAPKPAVKAAVAGRFVVQLGAFSTETNARQAWARAERRYGIQAEPFTTTIDHGGRTLHRVSVAGFDSQASAARMCGSIKAKGGACFVRTTAGDALASWAPASVARRV